MKIGIDAREIQDGVCTGIGRPLVNFLNYFTKQDNDDECILFSSKPVLVKFGKKSRLPPQNQKSRDSLEQYAFLNGKKVRNVVIKGCPTFYWDQVKLPRAIKKEAVEIFYSPYYKIPLFAHCKTVSAILDLMYLVFEPYKRDLGFAAKFYYATMGKLFVRKADKILTCSQHSKQDIIKKYKAAENKIKIIPLSIANLYRPEFDKNKIAAFKNKFGIDGRYILYLGNFKPHKNVENIILAFKEILSEFKDLKLILAGHKVHLYSELKDLAEKLLIFDKIIFTGSVSESDQPDLLYSGAEAFVMPSFYEGFGLPPVEAMACGVPVVASNTTSLPEVIKGAGLLINPGNSGEIAGAVIRILKDENLKKELVAKGIKRAEDFREEKVSEEMYKFFKSLLKK